MYKHQLIFFRSNFKAEGNLKQGTPPYRVFCLFLIAFLLFSTSEIFAQGVGINPSGSNPDPSAMLDVSGASKGVLINRMTTVERNAIASPANSLLIYNTTTRCLEIYANGLWQSVFCTACPLPSAVTASGSPTSLCEGSTLTLTSGATGATNWSWTGPNGFTSTLQNPTIPNITAAGSGVYALTASNTCGSAVPVNTASVTVNTVPSAPTAGTHTPSQTQIIWNWNTVSGATGYKYNTINTYSSATDNGASTSYTQTGLTCNTPYTLYVWAYNSCGNSASTLLSQTTSACCIFCCTSGIISTKAGTGIAGFSGDGGAATSAQLNFPIGVAFDGSGNVYIADRNNNRIRKITVSTGIITTIAGTGTAGFAGDGGSATAAQLNNPWGVALDGSGNVYIPDSYNNRIRKITVSTGIITTIAGIGTAGFSGDGAAATGAQLSSPYQVALDASGNVYMADGDNNRIRKITVSTGIISTIAGTGTAGYNGDGIAATSAQLNNPSGVAFDGSGNVYIADKNNQRIRKVTVSTGFISTIAGNGTVGYNGDGIAATSAQLQYPFEVALDASGNVYIADASNDRIRKITVSTGIISTIAGTGTAGFAGDGGAATGAQLSGPRGVALDASGNVYLTDFYNHRIRVVCH